MTAHIYVLMGGLVGPDGIIDSVGMTQLSHRLQKYGVVRELFWSDFDMVEGEIRALPPEHTIILIGYSGGGSRATWVAKAVYPRKIKLLVAYDPSPAWQMVPLRDNVEKALSYHNSAPLMFGLGGGRLVGRQVEIIEVAQQHLAVQFNEQLHVRTIEAVQLAVV